ncbi:MAG: hypothetical protein IT176_05675 [Acidobacteria bacterium]|nr:hypothetical protein [Acidobacteriota bacterium]
MWEQPPRDRLRGVPAALEVRMEAESIRSGTLKLSGATLMVAAAAFATAIWLAMRRGRTAG